MKVNISDLESALGPVTDDTLEEMGMYSFQSVRQDGYVIFVSIRTHDERLSVSILNSSDHGVAAYTINHCSEIRLIDRDKKLLEVLHEDGKAKGLLNVFERPFFTYSV